MEIGERIKEVRKATGYTQQAFAERLGLKRNTIGGYEVGLVSPSDRTITDICDKFNVNEKWLREGTGEMFCETSRDDSIADFVADIMKGSEDEFKRRFVAALAKLSPDEWKMIEKMALTMVEELKKD